MALPGWWKRGEDVTIKDIAKLAGVSSAAVSRYLNGGSLSQEKREAIRAVIQQTSYRPAPAAQSLRTKVTDYIGVIVPKISSDAVGRVTAGITRVLSQQGYLCLLANTDNNAEQELEYLDLFQGRSVAGIILMATVLTPRHQDALQSCTVPLVVAGQQCAGVPCVYHDDYNAAKAVTERLFRRGRERLAYIAVTDQDVAVGLRRRQGVRAALMQAGRSADIPTAVSDFQVESGRTAMEQLLSQHPDLDGVICATDQIAIGAMEALRAAGRNLPEDVSVAGLDDNWAGQYTTPKLTTAHFYYEDCGSEAANMLLSMLTQKDAPIRQTMLGYCVVERESV